MANRTVCIFVPARAYRVYYPTSYAESTFFFSFQVCHFSESTVLYTKINVDIIYFEITNKLIYDFYLLSAMMNPASWKLEVLFVIYFCSNFLPHRRSR